MGFSFLNPKIDRKLVEFDLEEAYKMLKSFPWNDSQTLFLFQKSFEGAPMNDYR